MAKVITRFAPSPTGTLHIGGVRTALFNYVYAKQNNGQFLIRIEDTDRERSTKEFEENILSNLNSIGLNLIRSQLINLKEIVFILLPQIS